MEDLTIDSSGVQLAEFGGTAAAKISALEKWYGEPLTEEEKAELRDGLQVFGKIAGTLAAEESHPQLNLNNDRRRAE